MSVSSGLTLIRTVASLTAATSGVCRETTTRRNIHSHVSLTNNYKLGYIEWGGEVIWPETYHGY